MPPSEQAAGRAIISNRNPPSHNRRSPAHSASQNHPSHYYTNTDYYSQPSALNGYSNQHQGYPKSISDVDRYTLNDREGDGCTLHSKQSFEVMPNDENCVSFFSSPTPTSMNPLSDGRDDSDTEPNLFSPEAEDNSLSKFGPRMRFVSPPPWEKSRYDDDNDDDDDNVSLSDGFSVFSGRFAGRRYREPEKVSIRSLALASMRTPSPTPTTSSRSPYGKANLNASQSQVSLSIKDAPWASRPTPESPSSGRPSFSFSIRDRGASSNLPTDHSTKQKGRPPHSPLSQDDDATVSCRSDSPTSVGPYTHHPYANPDVIPQSGQPNVINGAPPVSYHQQQQRQSNESDPGFVRRASESATVATTARVPPTFRKASAGNLPISQPKPSPRPILVKHDGSENEIPLLAPVPRNVETGLSSPKSPYSSHSPVPFPDSPMNNLLTLDEAQRIKKASPESPTQSRFRTGSTLVAGFGLPPGVTHDFEVKRNQSLSPSDSSSTIRETKFSNARQRTISSSKLSIVNSSPSSEDVGSTKTIKHKKSGFMKLFGKDKESVKEPPSPSSNKAPVHSFEPVPPVPKRAPPPSLSVVVTSPSVSFPEIETHNHIQQQKSSPPTQQAFPATVHTPLDPTEDNKSQYPEFAESRPILSAPPSQSTFEGLSLRPMSMVFSAKFSELFGSLDGSEALSPPVMPAASKTSGGGSPTTSDFSSRSNSSDYPLTPSSTALSGVAVNIVGRQEDNSIASLQAQLINMQKNHQREIWELESQIRDLKRENEELRSTGTCESCGKLKYEGRLKFGGSAVQTSVVDRPRPKVCRDARSVFGGS